MKNKGKNLKVLAISIFLLSIAGMVFAQENYVPYEAIPGTSREKAVTLPDYIGALFKFSVWGIGIAALLMISIGGFMYFTTAGNTSKMEKAKTIITDALLGLVAVLVVYVIFSTINPDLVNFDLSGLRTLRN